MHSLSGRPRRPLDSIARRSAALALVFSLVLSLGPNHASASTIGLDQHEYVSSAYAPSPLTGDTGSAAGSAEGSAEGSAGQTAGDSGPVVPTAASGTRAGTGGLTGAGTVTVTVTIGGYAVIEDSSPGVTWDRFVPSASGNYSAGTYAYGRWMGTRIEARFTGSEIVWLGPKQPNYGMADVYIDNVKLATVDCYAPAASAMRVTTLWASPQLTPGAHTISIRLTGAGNPASSGNVVVVDRFALPGASAGVTGMRVNETAGTFSGLWIESHNTSYTGSTYRYSRWPSARYSITFTGTRIAWLGPRTRDYGKVALYMDGAYVTTFSQYGVMGWRYRVWESAVLPRGQHTLEIRVLGTKQAESTCANVVIDGFDVTP